MADKFHSDTQEKIESINYVPGLKDSGDLEASTKTVTATSKQGTPDYSTSLTTVAPGDSRLVVKRLCVRLQIAIDSMTAGHLYGAIHVNGVERKTLDFTSTGDNFIAITLTEGQFNVGAANTLEVFLWVDTGNAVVSVCQLWQGVGSCETGGYYQPALELSYTGLLSASVFQMLQGSGSETGLIFPLGITNAYELMLVKKDGVNTQLVLLSYLCGTGLGIVIRATVGTDLAYLNRMHFVLRSLQ